MSKDSEPSPNSGRDWFSWVARKVRRENPVVLSSSNQGVKLEKKHGTLWFLKINTEPVVEDPRTKNKS